jgi:hypothetical protein
MEATFIKKIDWRSDARLYKISRPVEYGYGEFSGMTRYVIVSAITFGYGSECGDCETFIFPAFENGKAIEMLEMSGSERGTLDHHKVLFNMGVTQICYYNPDADNA